MQGWIAEVCGIAAGLGSTVSFLPQAIKSWTEKDTRALSLPMYSINVFSFVLWVIYGVLIASLPVIVFNSLCLLLSSSILGMKIYNLLQRRKPSS